MSKVNLSSKYTKQIPVLLLLLLSLLFANLQKNKRSGGNDICFNICGDARGYYAWLPALFIYHDLNFHFADTVEALAIPCSVSASGIPIQDYRYSFDNRTCNKYYPGASLLMSPFFAVAHFFTLYFSHYAPNGYSKLYFEIMPLAGVFYYLMGMLLFLSTIRRFGASPWLRSILILMLTFGTNLLYYTIDAPLYAHVYCFFLISAILYCTVYLQERYSAIHLALLSLLAGWLFITRPVDLCIIILLPFIFYPRRAAMIAGLKKSPYRTIWLMLCLVMPALLFSCYKISSGHFFLYSYKNEGFNFAHPHISAYLFSYDNGVLPYTPLLIIPFLLVCIRYYSGYRNIIIGSFITLSAIIYINASWWCWWFGFSFGARALLDFLPVSGLMLALALHDKNIKRYIAVLSVSVACSALTFALYELKSTMGYMTTYPVRDYGEALHKIFTI